MKYLLSVSILLFAVVSSVFAEEKTTPLYPLKVGNKWTYKVSGGSIEVKAEKKVKVGNDDGYDLVTSSQGKVSASEQIVVREDGIYRELVNGLKPESPIKFLQLPASKGAKWNVKTKVQGQEVEGEFVIREEDVTVPLGTYKAATLVEGANFKIAGMETTIKCWFAKDVGIVKLEFKLGGQDATLELEKFEEAK